jgi:NifB/MoaA-like Fe-S oxidoreductase
VLTLSVVPVGLTVHNINRPVRLLTPAEAAAAIGQLDAIRERARRERGQSWAFVGDEMYFIAGLPLPAAEAYDDWPLTENGVGAVRRFLEDFDAGLPHVARHDGKRIGIVTGTRMAAVIAPLAERLRQATGAAAVDVIGVVNGMYGETVNTAGLLPGGDIAAAARAGNYDILLLPAEALNDDARFVDDMELTALERMLAPARVVPAHELTSVLENA